jgi:hypothetical protein
MTDRESIHLEGIKAILSKCKSLEWTQIKFQEFATENKVDYYIFSAMKHLGLIEIKKTGQNNFIRSKVSVDSIEPIHVQHVMEDIRKTYAQFSKRKKNIETEVEKAVNGVKEELILVKEELAEKSKYSFLNDAALVAVKTLQDQGFTVLLKKELNLEFAGREE